MNNRTSTHSNYPSFPRRRESSLSCFTGPLDSRLRGNDGKLYGCRERGYILLPVVLLITLVAAVAWMLNNASLLDGGITASVAESAQAEYVAQAGLQHALQQTRQSGCGPFADLTGAPLGNHSYTTTLTSGLGSTTSYTVAVDQDAWIRNDNPTDNKAADDKLHVRFDSGIIERPLYRYDLSAIPANAPILSATAWFYVTMAHPEGPVDIHRLTADWAETDATWNSLGDRMDAAVLATIPTQPTADAWVPVNLTAQVQAWVNGQSNYGIALNSTSEGMSADYASREYGSQPYLEVVVASPGGAATLAATGTMDSGINRTITRDNVALYQRSSHYALQPNATAGMDAMIYQWKSNWNYGSSNSLYVYDWGSDSDYHSLLQFDLGGIPYGATIHSAQLMLYQNTNSAGGGSVGVHRITRNWVEGNGNGSTAPGVTWNESNTGLPWTTPGGDFTGEADAVTTIPAGTKDWISWDITGLVSGWVNDVFPNNGLALVPESSNANAYFDSSDATNPALRPKLTVTYACECGSPCIAPQGSGNVLMVVVNPTALVPADAEKKALFESWGYTVNVISESANQGTFDAGATANDVVYVSSTVNSNTLGGKLANLPIGIVSEDGDYNPDLGFAADAAWTVGSAINVTDTSHYVTAPFAAGPLEIYSGGMEQLTVSGTEGPGLQTLADTGGAGSLVVLDQGAMGSGGSAVAGPRVMLPLGRWASFNWDYLNANGRLLVQRALQWGTGNLGAPLPNLLLVVVDPSSLTAQEAAKKVLIESWGYTVNLIDESDSQANFDAAIAANDVAYIPQDINSTNLGTKLRNATIGVVNEEGEQVDELGIAGDKLFKTRHEIDIVDNLHYITQPFATGLLTFVSSDQSVHMLAGDIAPGLLTLAESFNVGSHWEPSLAVIETGDDLDISGTAAGRRVQLPWGGGTFDINQLNDDGRTIMQRAIEWGAGAAGAPPQTILFVVPDATALGPQDTAKKTLMESWGFDVSLITAAEPQSVFDAAVASADVAYISEETLSGDTNTKLRDATIGVVNEETALTDEFGIAGTRTGYTGTDIEVVNITHYITSVFASGPLTIASSSTALNRLTASIAPGLDALAVTSGDPELGTIETGGQLYDGGTAAGRRVQLPWGPDDFDINLLNGDGQTLMRRAIEWGAGAGSVFTMPIAHWKLDETTGTTAVDSAGGHNGTTANTTWTTGHVDGALEFNSSADSVTVPDAAELSITDELTITAWIDKDGLSGYDPAVTKATTGSDLNYLLGTWEDEVVFGFSTATDNWQGYYTSGANLSTGTWYHIAATYDNAGNAVRIYLDGMQIFSTTTTLEPVTNSGPVRLGRSAVNEYWPGRLDDVRIYDQVLSDAEIATLASGGGGGGGSPPACAATFADDFETDDYTGSTGTAAWAGDWTEINDSGNPGNGDVVVAAGSGNLVLQMGNSLRGAQRIADLSGHTSATLELGYWRSGLDGADEYATVEVSTDGSSWTLLDQLIGPGNDSTSAPPTVVSYDISGHLSATTHIRFVTSTNNAKFDRVLFDDIEICANN